MDTSSRDITTILDELKNQLIDCIHESINKAFEKYKYDKDKEHIELEPTHEKDSHGEIKKNQDDCIPNKEGKNEETKAEDKISDLDFKSDPDCRTNGKTKSENGESQWEIKDKDLDEMPKNNIDDNKKATQIR
jgi:hypothetical protein